MSNLHKQKIEEELKKGSKGAIISIVDSLIGYAHELKASDIHAEHKKVSFNLAESYANQGVLRLAQYWAQNHNYAGSETETISATDYFSVETIGGDIYRVRAKSVVQDVTTNMEINIDTTGDVFNITRWREISSF